MAKWLWIMSLVRSDYFILFRFLLPLAVTEIAVDVGEQFLNRSVSHAANVVDTLAAFGLAYSFVKFFVRILQEVKPVGVVLVRDRPQFLKILVCVLVMGGVVSLLTIIISKTQLGVWLIEDVYGVTTSVSRLTNQALFYFSFYPLIDAISWYHGGVLLQWRHSTLVGVASLANIIVQILSVAILLYTPLICNTIIAVPILAAYSGVITRCLITLGGFYYLVYPKLSRKTQVKVTLYKLTVFIAPLMFVSGVQEITRPTINLLVSKLSPNKCLATEALAILTAIYPMGRLVYGLMNQVRPISPTFQQKSQSSNNQSNNHHFISGKKIAIFIFASLCVSVVLSIIFFWVPGVSVGIMEHGIGLPHELALESVYPLRVYTIICFSVAVRASLTGWLTLHHQTKLITPAGFFRLGTVIAVFFALRVLGVSGALLGMLALFSGFTAESIVVTFAASFYACWRHWKAKKSIDEDLIEENIELSEAEHSSTV